MGWASARLRCLGSSVVFDPTNWTEPSYNDLMSQAYQDGARICNNSWGDGSSDSFYNLDSQEYDALVRDAQPAGSAFPAPGNQEMVIVFAAGNDGPQAGSVSPPATGKNIIAVGAAENVQLFGGADDGADSFSGTPDSQADNANAMLDFSGRGPCADGRQKPDLVAPGTHVSGGAPQAANPGPDGSALLCFRDMDTNNIGVSGGSDGSRFFPDTGQQFYTASSGTSHSTPCVSGGCALVRQYFINQGWTPPSPAMTKAWLMNSARYMTGAYANDTLWSPSQGMGEMYLGMAFDDTPRLLRDQAAGDMFTASGQTRVFTSAIADSSQPFRVTVAWTDAPGSTTGAAYNNNLDLTVAVGGHNYKGNVFNGAFSVTGGSADSRNNVESVFLPAGVSGPVTVTVTAASINSVGVPGGAGLVNQDFALVVYNAGAAPALAPGGAVLAQESCLPANGVIDPGETVTVNFTIQNAGSASTTNLVATLQAGNGITVPSGPQTYGALAPGASGTAAYSFEAEGACGGVITATLRLQDGAANLGAIHYYFQLGQLVTVTNFAESFDSVSPPNLPAGWTTSDTSGGQTFWTTQSGISDSTPNSVYCPDSGFADEVYLTSPRITLPSGPSQLSFRQSFNLEDQYDGGILQIKLPGATAFAGITAAGGSFAMGGYVETTQSDFSSYCRDNPLVGHSVWSGNSDGFVTSIVNLPASAQGKTIQLRWACGTDCTNEILEGLGGWWIDSIRVTQTNWSCCGSLAAPVLLFSTNQFDTNTGSLTVAGTGVPGAKVSIYDGTNLLGTATVNSSDLFHLPIKLTNGAHQLTASEIFNGVTSPASGPVAITVILTPVITAQPPPALTGFLKETLTISAGAYGAAPLRYAWEKNGVRIAGAAGPKLTLAGLVAGSAASYRMIAGNSYGSVTSTVAVLSLVPNPFVNLTGNYYGLFLESPARFESSGFLQLRLGTLGGFSGSILNAGRSNGFSGGFSVAGQARVTVASSIVNMNLDLAGGSEQITGGVSNASWSAGLRADRATFGGTNPFLTGGKFNMAFQNSGDGSASPGGDGYGTVSINTNGMVSWSGALADNTSVPVRSAVSISKDGLWPLYVPLYGKLGSLSGWITLANGAFTGEANWFRVGASGKLYPDGITNTLSIAGSSFAPGTSSQPVLEPTNLLLTLSGGGLGANLSRPLALYDTGKFVFVTNSGDISNLTLSVMPGTGVISGSFIDPETHLKAAIKGVVLQRQSNAAGFFLGTNATGSFQLTPAP